MTDLRADSSPSPTASTPAGSAAAAKVVSAEATAAAEVVAPEATPGSRFWTPWRTALAKGAVFYVVSRLMVMAATGVAAVAEQPRPTSARRPIIDLLTSWDSLWYLRIVRDGYPSSIPAHVTFHQPEARAAFFPLYPLLVRAADRVLPGGDVAAALFLNLVLGAVFIYLLGVLTRRLKGDHAAARVMVLAAVFPGSFVLSFAYAEAILLVLACATFLLLLDRRWVLAGLAAGLATASRPNAIALVLACAAAAWVAWRRERDWKAWAAPLLAPLGFVAFQVYLSWRTGERLVWFRVQHQGWNEGISFGLTAITKTTKFLAHPLDSPTNAITALCLVALAAGLWALWKARLPAPIVVYTLVSVFLMLVPAQVTARPRFLYTAVGLLIAVAAVWPDDDKDWWALVLCVSSAGLVALIGLYGFAAVIP
jgi:hypothetical protein